MNEETVLARLRTEIRYTEGTRAWAKGAADRKTTQPERTAWLSDESMFLGEFRGSYSNAVLAATEPALRNYFAELGLDDPEIVQVRITDSYPGSWVIDAAVVAVVAMGVTYKILKEVSELPAIVEGLADLGRKFIGPAIQDSIDSEVSRQLDHVAENEGLPPAPPHPVDTSVTLDARPLLGLRPAKLASRKIHLGVSVTDGAVAIENLGEKPLEDLYLGIFCGDEPRHSWSLEEAYRASVPSLGAKQTIAKGASDFRNDRGEAPELGDGQFVECWIQDGGGIHLFQFVRERSA